MNSFISEFITRLKTQQPAFFKKLQLLAIILGAAAGVTAWVVSDMPGVPAWVVILNKDLALVCGSAAFTSVLPNKDINQ